MLTLLALAMTITADHHENDAKEAAGREYYALMVYEADAADGAAIAKTVDESVAVTLRQIDGVSRVGVFTETDEQPKGAEPTGNVYVIAACDDVRTAAGLVDRLGDRVAGRRTDAEGGFNAADPAKVTTMIAFASIPKLEISREKQAGADRVFEMRTYYSADADKARLKMEMFDEGETQLMRDVNLQPVFYGSALVGRGETPHLVYLLSAPSIDDHKTNWQGFLDSPVWDKMKRQPRYGGTVSKIEQVFLQPTPGSDI